MGTSIVNHYKVSSFGRLVAVMNSAPEINKEGLHFNTKHGMSGSKEYGAWRNMRKRCYDPKHKSYKYYGARGISVCNEWNKSFINFYLFIGKAPSKKHSIDRIDNDGNYEPGNVMWATKKQQVLNRRNTCKIEYNGITKTLTEWCEIKGISPALAYARLTQGLSPNLIFTKGRLSDQPNYRREKNTRRRRYN